MAQLEQLPVHELKIDRSFVAGLGESREGRFPHRREAIVLAVLELSRRLGIDVVAEGAEDPAALRWLVRSGCHWRRAS